MYVILHWGFIHCASGQRWQISFDFGGESHPSPCTLLQGQEGAAASLEIVSHCC